MACTSSALHWVSSLSLLALYTSGEDPWTLQSIFSSMLLITLTRCPAIVERPSLLPCGELVLYREEERDMCPSIVIGLFVLGDGELESSLFVVVLNYCYCCTCIAFFMGTAFITFTAGALTDATVPSTWHDSSVGSSSLEALFPDIYCIGFGYEARTSTSPCLGLFEIICEI